MCSWSAYMHLIGFFFALQWMSQFIERCKFICCRRRNGFSQCVCALFWVHSEIGGYIQPYIPYTCSTVNFSCNTSLSTLLLLWLNALHIHLVFSSYCTLIFWMSMKCLHVCRARCVYRVEQRGAFFFFFHSSLFFFIYESVAHSTDNLRS